MSSYVPACWGKSSKLWTAAEKFDCSPGEKLGKSGTMVSIRQNLSLWLYTSTFIFALIFVLVATSVRTQQPGFFSSMFLEMFSSHKVENVFPS